MILPERVVEIAHGTTFFELGTRDASLHPLATFVLGARVAPDRSAVTCYIPTVEAERVLGNLRENGRVALAFSEPTSHESYQVKGTFRAAAVAGPADMAVVGVWADKAVAFMKAYGLPDSFFAGFSLPPLTAVTFAVEELFAQTPGPGAGAKVG